MEYFVFLHSFQIGSKPLKIMHIEFLITKLPKFYQYPIKKHLIYAKLISKLTIFLITY